VKLLLPFELAYRELNRLRRRLYQTRLLSRQRLPRPVISVGNISMGGSGKTPLTIHLARALVSRGWTVVILSRGYRREGAERMALVDSDDPRRFGDEPVLIRRHVADARVIVGADRHAAGVWALSRQDCDLFILDDGFQHLRLDRDVDIVIDDPEARHLREPETALRSADIILRRAEQGGERAEDPPGVFRLRTEPTDLIHRGERRDLGILAGREVAAFAGLANNDRFFATLESLGARIVAKKSFRDHVDYDEADVESLLEMQRSSGADLLVTTEKDWVKLPRLDLAVLTVEAVVSPLAEFHSEVIRRLEDASRRHGRITPEFERSHG
jgi:tetraacyldisaccharide 4'-kinase